MTSDPSPISPADVSTGQAARQEFLELLNRPVIGSWRYHALRYIALIPPLLSAVYFLGFRSILTVILTLFASAAFAWAWTGVGRRGRLLQLPTLLSAALVLALFLPAETADPLSPAAFSLLIAAAFLITLFIWAGDVPLLGRIHPVALVLAVVLCIQPASLTPTLVLSKQHALTGDLLNTPPSAPPSASPSAPSSASPSLPLQPTSQYTDWWLPPPPSSTPPSSTPSPAQQHGSSSASHPTPPEGLAQYHAVRLPPASHILGSYSKGQVSSPQGFLSLDIILRDELPPLRNYAYGGQPMPIGCTSVASLILSAAILRYTRMTRWQPMAAAVLAFSLACLILPVPVTLSSQQQQWASLLFSSTGTGSDLSPATTLTFVCMQLFSTPFLLMLMLVVLDSSHRPMSRRGQILSCVLFAALAAAFQLYWLMPWGCVPAAILTGLATPHIDKLFPTKTLV